MEAEAKWTEFRRRQFQMNFLELKCMNFALDFTEIRSQGSNQQYSSIGLDDGLAPSRRQAIIWTNDGYFTDAYISFGLNELNTFFANRYFYVLILYSSNFPRGLISR